MPANGRFAPADVDVGREAGDMTEIRNGIAAGQRVVVSGQFLVDSEASLKGALARISASGDTVAQAGAADSHAGHQMPTSASATHKAEGVVRAVGDEVLIKHGAIPLGGHGRDDDGVQGAERRHSRERQGRHGGELRLRRSRRRATCS